MTHRERLTLRSHRGAYSHRRTGRDAPVVFDCDGTLIHGDIGEAMLYFQLEHFLFRVSPAEVWPDHPRRKLLNELYETLSTYPPRRLKHNRRFSQFAHMVLSWYFGQLAEGMTTKACADIVRLFSGFSSSEARTIANATVNEEFCAPLGKKKLGGLTVPRGVRFIRETLRLLKKLSRKGNAVCVVSGSNRWSVEAVMRHARLTACRVIGIDLVEVGGLLSSTVKEPVPVLRGKVDALKRIYARRPALVVSDSLYDRSLFRYSADLKILVQSHDGHADEFFSSGRIRKDSSWIVIDKPTLLT